MRRQLVNSGMEGAIDRLAIEVNRWRRCMGSSSIQSDDFLGVRIEVAGRRRVLAPGAMEPIPVGHFALLSRAAAHEVDEGGAQAGGTDIEGKSQGSSTFMSVLQSGVPLAIAGDFRTTSQKACGARSITWWRSPGRDASRSSVVSLALWSETIPLANASRSRGLKTSVLCRRWTSAGSRRCHRGRVFLSAFPWLSTISHTHTLTPAMQSSTAIRSLNTTSTSGDRRDVSSPVRCAQTNRSGGSFGCIRWR